MIYSLLRFKKNYFLCWSIFMLEDFVGALQESGLVLNASKTFVLTTEAQPPTSLRLQNGAEVSVLPRDCTRTEFGCGTSFAKRCSGMVRAQVDVVRQEHSTGFAPFAPNFFHAVITPVACFATGHRTLYPRDVRKYDIEWSMVNPVCPIRSCQHAAKPFMARFLVNNGYGQSIGCLQTCGWLGL